MPLAQIVRTRGYVVSTRVNFKPKKLVRLDVLRLECSLEARAAGFIRREPYTTGDQRAAARALSEACVGAPVKLVPGKARGTHAANKGGVRPRYTVGL